MRNFFEEGNISAMLAAGTFINGAFGGTVNGAPLARAEYHSVVWLGTLANNGTLNVYGCTNSAGSNPVIVKSLPFGSSNSPAVAVDVKTSALGSLSAALGTTYTHLGAYGTVESGGTVRGALFIMSYAQRTLPPGTTGLAAYGTFLT